MFISIERGAWSSDAVGPHEGRTDMSTAAGPCLATARRRLRAPACAVDDIDLQLLEFGDALIDALVPYPGHRRPVFPQQRESAWQGGQLRRDFLEAEAGALTDRDVADL